MRRVTVFGSTGSIGESTLDLLSREQDVQVIALTGGRNVERLAEQARTFRAGIAVTAFDDCLPALRDALQGSGVEAASGSAALLEAADRPADWVMSAIVGAAGLAPGLHALGQGKVLALANKESLVSAGPLLLGSAVRHGATVLPVDSEHSAIFQALRGEDQATVERVIITASGGPFRTWSREAMARATPAEAGRHPNWDMGQRITIDSASLFNKAMEVIETREFFGFSPHQIEVLVHPQSAVHALVGFVDGALMAHLGAPDMRHAIGHALHWPERRVLPVERLDLARLGRLDFEAPDEGRFPALRLARDVMRAGGLAGAVFTAAKETALDHFIAGRIGFLDMAGVVEESLTRLAAQPDFGRPADNLDAVLAMDGLARRTAAEIAAMRGLTTTGA
ncbi:1-deoxy-D-xylulose-5-phosphate reductoisomerase [Haematobacter massiliensis]|mgnify:CR=1 FL=1|uniref:1-deoxy-D-xylulose 5-phosphate reductoisomerase n=1 Tax=Haematobacter massiliensis TaxID=195105 RepID=A0A086Y0B9_9RHOB|nr:1-deoxy-D-xylulose-5-phosphate reductoisomerase [Haematobacter massiliensis]KFI27719.1 1-deoxy-D-xylulose 5-phosphate reductoisomerase [Haematobacter massiliensis]OWJ71846.1 1-deoxy-D-xylulose-5-phosphate reductoisomerase [Haematobacter massiliensis]OWJ83117.1 1-deoxy-D-xylulose-5-phosphate reductoisomerase [Haematobacter massiliensis]QBJ23935.1 1-deoxy-D-xylulose-5-phosphate reductoisomerase [Haematobacter massiliensis]